MKTQIEETVLFGHQCVIEKKVKQVILTSSRPKVEITGGSLDEAALLFWRSLKARPRTLQEREGLEQEVREALRHLRLPRYPVPVSGRHVVITRKNGRELYRVRRTMDVPGRRKLYFGSYATHHAAALASCRLCEIINESIEIRRAALLSVKM